MPKLYTIYKATNKINGKCYIGFDSKWPTRKEEHIASSFNTYNEKYQCHETTYNSLFHAAIRKFGVENFEWTVLFQSRDPFYTLYTKEPFFIVKYNSYAYPNNAGYNMTRGGDSSVCYMPLDKNSPPLTRNNPATPNRSKPPTKNTPKSRYRNPYNTNRYFIFDKFPYYYKRNQFFEETIKIISTIKKTSNFISEIDPEKLSLIYNSLDLLQKNIKVSDDIAMIYDSIHDNTICGNIQYIRKLISYLQELQTVNTLAKIQVYRKMFKS